MAHIVESPYLQLVIDPEDASWSLSSREERFSTVDAVRMEVWYRMGRGLFLALSRWNEPQWIPPQSVASPHGNLKQTALTFLDENGVRYILTFALSEQHPLMLWKITVRNDTHKTDPAPAPGDDGCETLPPERHAGFLLERLAVVELYRRIWPERSLPTHTTGSAPVSIACQPRHTSPKGARSFWQ